MSLKCPYCCLSTKHPAPRPRVVRFGKFRRKSDSRIIQRFRCLNCKRCFSFATRNNCFRQNKRLKNEPLRLLLVSGVSQRRAARILRVSRTTIVRKFRFLARLAQINNENSIPAFTETIFFDDMESFEHSKCKPLSITLAVDVNRRVLGFRVAEMPAKGPLAEISRKKYGRRRDMRRFHRRALLKELSRRILGVQRLKSDENPHYISDVKELFPGAQHITFKGARGSLTGGGELKKLRSDPLFKLNHTCAMFRANINRLFRRTWNTTKKAERLSAHIAIYAEFHNHELI